MIPYSYEMVDMGGLDLAEANGTVVEGLYDRIAEAVNACGDVILYNWKFAGIEIAPSAVNSIEVSGGILINGLIQVTELDQVTVIGVPPPIVPVSPLSVTENGTYEAEPPASGFNPVNVEVPIVLEDIRITENGTYLVPQGKDGYGTIIVEVEGGSMTRTELFYAENGAASGVLSADITSFDYVEFEVVHIEGATKYAYNTIWSKEVMLTTLATTCIASICAYSGAYFNLTLPTASSFNNIGYSGVCPRRITGINF